MKISYLGLILAVVFEYAYLLLMNYHIHNASNTSTSTLMILTIVHILGIYLVLTINLKKKFAVHETKDDNNVSDEVEK